MAHLDPSMAEEYTARLSDILRAAIIGKAPSADQVRLSGISWTELYHPLTEKQLNQLRECTSLSHHEATFTRVPGSWEAQEGLLILRMRYDFAGHDVDGNTVSVQQEGAIGLKCTCAGEGEPLVISDVESCKLTADGSVRRPSRFEHQLRKQRRSANNKEDQTALETALEFVIEFILEAFFDV